MKKDNIYLANGYINIPLLLSYPENFIFLIGARGIGKTYGILQHCLINKLRFCYIRRTDTQLQVCKSDKGNPFKKLNSDYNLNIRCDSDHDITGFFNFVYDDDKQKYVKYGDLIGYAFALSTFANLRSIDLSDVDIIIYDEFIKQTDERPIKNEATAFLNMCETIMRNRELQCLPALKVICAANSNSLDNDLLYYLQLVTIAEKMQRTGKELYINNDRCLRLYIPNKSPISEAKTNTSLYKLTAGTDFAKMALENRFVDDDTSLIAQRPLVEYIPHVTIGEICIYKHKSRYEYYVSTHKSGTPNTFSVSDRGCTMFKRQYPYLWDAFYLDGKIFFETYGCQAAFQRYLKGKKY